MIYVVVDYGYCDNPYCYGYIFSKDVKAFKDKDSAQQYLQQLQQQDPHSHYTIVSIPLAD